MLTIPGILDCQLDFGQIRRLVVFWCALRSRKCNASTLEMLTVANGKSTMSRTRVQLWCNRFKEGREGVNDNASRGRPKH